MADSEVTDDSAFMVVMIVGEPYHRLLPLVTTSNPRFDQWLAKV